MSAIADTMPIVASRHLNSIGDYRQVARQTFAYYDQPSLLAIAEDAWCALIDHAISSFTWHCVDARLLDFGHSPSDREIRRSES